MAERKAVNKYYPPDWEPSKGSINTFRGTHPLRERARKLHQGILIIRFELPYNIWCDGCNNHVGTGVRYNAEKSKTGKYFSTPIYKFRMKCHLCDNHFEIQTDPKNHDYVILNGARRQERRWDPKDNEQVVPEEKEVSKKLMTDSMFKLEHDLEDKDKAKAAASSLQKLEDLQMRWKDDYSCNRLLRSQFRSKKNEAKLSLSKDTAILKKFSLPTSLKLLPETKDDPKLAQLMKLESTGSIEEKKQELRQNILKGSIFKCAQRTRVEIKNTSSKLIAGPTKQLETVARNPKKTTDKSQKASLVVDYSASEDSE